ncbi:hypothetical protein EMIT0P2_40149 [Pseudomonas sp. IT-P2]
MTSMCSHWPWNWATASTPARCSSTGRSPRAWPRKACGCSMPTSGCIFRPICPNGFSSDDRCHALRGNAARDAPRHWTRSVPRGIPTQSMGTISTVNLKPIKNPEGLTPFGVVFYSQAYNLAMDTSVDFTKAITSLPTSSSSSLTERVVITDVTMPEAVCTSISDSTSPRTISLIAPLNWLRTLMALIVMIFLLRSK